MPTKSQQLRQSFLVSGAGAAVLLVVAVAWFTSNRATYLLEGQADARGRDVAARVAATVTQYLNERRREVVSLASMPQLIAAVRQADQDAVARGLDRLEISVLERNFTATRQLGGDPDLRDYLRAYTTLSDFAEMFVTESHGFNVLTSDRPSDFVQRDETWWQRAFEDGVYEGEAKFDSSAAAASLEFDVAIRAPRRDRPVGVLKAVFALDQLAKLLGADQLAEGAYLEVVDGRGLVLMSRDPSLLLLPLPGKDRIPLSPDAASVRVETALGEELVVTVPANQGEWWVLYRQPVAQAFAASRTTQRAVWLGALLVAGVAVGALFWLSQRLSRLVTEPVKAAGAIASRVAGGDLSVTVSTQRAEAAEVSELLSSVHSMVVALRRLVGAIRGAADEAAAMAAEISASTQQMSAATQEMAATSQDLSKRAGEQAQLVRAAAADAARILQISAGLAQGADEAARRNADLAAAARGHKGVLDQSTVQLAKLAEEVAKGAEEAEALAQASSEIQKFVVQTKAVATQTNMLALNAAIEAARAGPQGRGFAIVADEVRKLASVAATAAGETADTVRGVLTRVQGTRDRLVRLAAGGAAVREAAQSAAQGLAAVAGEADANDAWSREIAQSAAEMRKLVEEIANRLGSVAQQTDGLLASAEELAASAQEQSASTAEIASSANQLAEAADKLTGAVKSFRLLADEVPAPPPPPAERQAAD
ncbi:MAG TPA: methyl-accepting chemotaxis protein [Gemmatimonadales bacterium]|jgi:methyl-accepting chemotaxis protein|nr:methyl-accepting chemotaxis protein [Gemmatimonadales bacterium]